MSRVCCTDSLKTFVAFFHDKVIIYHVQPGNIIENTPVSHNKTNSTAMVLALFKYLSKGIKISAVKERSSHLKWF